MKNRLLPSMVLLAAATLSVFAQSGGEEQVIRKFFADSDVAWNKHDARLLTNDKNASSDADFVNVYGGWAKGRDNFVAIMTKLQAGPFHDDIRQTIVEKVKFVRPDVAVVITTINDRHGDGPSAQTRGTFVLSKENGLWLLTSFQNTKIVEAPEPGRPPQNPGGTAH